MKAGELLAPDCFKHTLARPTEESGGKLSREQQLQEKGRKLKDYELMKQQVGEHAKTVVEQGNDKERSVLTYASQICTKISGCSQGWYACILVLARPVLTGPVESCSVLLTLF